MDAEIEARGLSERYPESAFGWKAWGSVLVKLNRHHDALPKLLEARRLAPEDSDALNTLGTALQRLGQHREARDCFEQAIARRPDFALAHNNLGTLLSDQGRFEAAIACFDRALAIDPQSVEAHSNRGLALRALGRVDEALEAYDRILAIRPTAIEVLNKRAILLQALGRLDAALADLDRALTIAPDYADAWTNRGNLLKDQGRLDEAQDAYHRALEIEPDRLEAWHNRLLALNYQADVTREAVFEAHCDFARRLGARVIRLPARVPAAQDRDPRRRLRLGLVSGDFRRHSVAFFLRPVLERLDRRAFEVFGYMTSHQRDDLTRIFQGLTDGWRECAGLGARALANQIRADGIDLLFDLSGHTEGNVLPAFAARPAPVQITWIGYPNTTGLATLDYRLVDAVTDPPGDADAFHSERLIRLPRGFLCYRPLDAAYGLAVGSAPCLKQDWITFGSFNNLAKITPETLDLWSAVLHAVPRARLRLKSHRAAEVQVWERLVADLERRGIAPERLETLPRADSQEAHLEQYQGIDIALDTYPYHGTTTTCEALFMGVPVVTLVGDRHAARVSASLLTRVGLNDWIAYSSDDYVRIAADLAADRRRLNDWRAALRPRLEQSPVRDELGFTRILEGVLWRMWQAWCAGESPGVFEVEPVEAPITTPSVSERQAVIEHFEQGRLAEAERAAQVLVERYPRASFGWKALGTSLARVRRSREAVVALRHALALSPDEAETLETLGKVLLNLNRLEEAEDCLRQAVELQPDDADAHNTLGAVLAARGHLTQAADSYRRALAICPETAPTLSNLATLLKDLGCVDEALEVYARALELQPQAAAIHSNRLFCLNYHSGLSREQVFAEHLEFQVQQATRIEPLPRVERDRDPRRRLRLGLVSADFRYHSVAFFIAPVIEHLDRQAFELVCYSRSHQRDAITESFERHASVWRACADLSDADLARLIRADGIDILIDLSGHSRGNALPVFAARPAPVQLSWIGYPNTTGLAAMDYRLVDDLTDPPGEADRYHSERLIRLPKGFLCYRPLIRADELPVGPPPSRDRGYVTFGSFNALGKISPVTLELWSAVLGAAPESRLKLKSSLAADGDAWDRVLEHFRARGIDPQRLEILPCSGTHKAHLERYRDIDIALDTYPYHGTTTTCEALFMGVPVVTLAGDRHAARVGVSLLSRVGLNELIASSPEEYARIALGLASEPEHLSLLRASLRERLERSPLRDEMGFTRTLEMVLRQIRR
nr:tetratricopeptide repeat protein [Allochromatium vinosum]